jgi:hypothetical protein
VILQVALDTPLRRVFDYLPPEELDATPAAGMRVRVPFGRQKLVGVITAVVFQSQVAPSKLRCALEILDERAILDPITFELLQWAADYYHHPVGEVFAAALPVSLRQGLPAIETRERWSLTELGSGEWRQPTDKRAPQQRALLQWIGERGMVSADEVAGKARLDFRHRITRRAADPAGGRGPRPQRTGTDARAGRGGQGHFGFPVQIRGAPALRGHGQRQDRGVLARHIRGHRGGWTGLGLGA